MWIKKQQNRFNNLKEKKNSAEERNIHKVHETVCDLYEQTHQCVRV